LCLLDNQSPATPFPVRYVTGILSDCCTLEDGTDWLSRNVGKQLPTYAVQRPRTPTAPFRSSLFCS
jgi:hypothetical protein